MSRIEITNVSKKFGSALVLDQINLTADEGEFLVLVGASGCGKSTLLRLIAGLETPDTGSISIDGKSMLDTSPSQRDVAMVFQNYALYPHLSVYDNMAFGLRQKKVPETVIDTKIHETGGILQIEQLFERKPKALSGGQRQRVALGRAMVRDPKVFLFDEPLSNLDAKLRQEMRLEIKKLHGLLKTTMVYVTHDQTEAMTMGDRIAIMRNGIIEQIDKPENIYSSPKNKFVASFIGMPQMNFIKGELQNTDSSLVFKSSAHEFKIPSDHYQFDTVGNWSSCTMGIRPENIHDNHFAEINDPQNTIEIKVELVENVGSNKYLHTNVGGDKMVVSVSGNSAISRNDQINLIFDMAKSHFFK